MTQTLSIPISENPAVKKKTAIGLWAIFITYFAVNFLMVLAIPEISIDVEVEDKQVSAE